MGSSSQKGKGRKKRKKKRKGRVGKTQLESRSVRENIRPIVRRSLPITEKKGKINL